jgi:Sec7-like guanine-nucleotide exchange factor
LKSLWLYLSNSKRTESGEETTDMVLQSKRNKDHFIKALELFKRNPNQGVQYFIEQSFLEDEEHLPQFLYQTPELDPVAVGQLLGSEGNENLLRQYLNCFDFKDRSFEAALRDFLTHFRIPGEAQIIDRFMETFGAKYYRDNPSIFTTADTVYVLAFSTLMLHTDAHHTELKSHMTLDQFVQNNRGIDGGKDLPVKFLTDLYNGITRQRIYAIDNTSLLTRAQRSELYQQKYAQILADAKSLSLSTDVKFNRIESGNLISPIFQLIWHQLFVVFALAFESSENKKIIKNVLSGLTCGSHIASHCFLEDILTTIMDCFAQFTRLRTYLHDQIKPKNIACTLALLRVAMSDRNFMRSAWPIVIAEVSAMEKSQYLPVPDLLFTGSTSLDREGIIDFVKAVCETSALELQEDPPRTFLLVRLADVAYFNLNRWKIVWEEIWSIVGEFLISVASQEDGVESVLQTSVNVLWQIARKFMAQKEPEEFHFQEHFMRPFFEIFLAQPSIVIKELILTWVGGLASECLQTMRSGWNVVFQILSHSSKEVRAKGIEFLVKIAADCIPYLSHSQALHLISVAMAFVVNGQEEEICDPAIQVFQTIARQLAADDADGWDCLYASLEKCATHSVPNLRIHVVVVGVEIAANCVIAEPVKIMVPDRLRRLCDLIGEIPKAESRLKKLRDRITAL